MKRTIVYKIVYRHINRKFYSGYSGYFNSSCLDRESLPPQVLEYTIGKKTVPKFGKIFAFSNLRDAVCYSDSNHVIFKAVAHGKVIKCKSRTIAFGDSTEAAMKAVWSKKSLRNFAGGSQKFQNVTAGTVLCDSLTLLEEVRQ